MYGGICNTALAAMNIDESQDPSQVDWSTVKGLTQFEPMVRFFPFGWCGSLLLRRGETKRTLTRYESDPVQEEARSDEVQRERQETWRETLVTVPGCKHWTKVNDLVKLRDHVASFAAAKEFKGVIGEKHRILFGSCDL